MVRTLNASTLLAAWERAASEPPLLRPIALLAAACPGTSVEEWLARPIGERDGELVSLREAWFGARFETTARCPACGDQVEATFTTNDLANEAGAPRASLEVEASGRRVGFRLPTTNDLLDVAQQELEHARERLLERCVPDAAELAAADIDVVLRAMAAADPQADIQVALACPNCATSWTISFDIVSHLWSEVEDWALRTLLEVHRLASAYGWSERDVLAMSAVRRQRYLDWVER